MGVSFEDPVVLGDPSSGVNHEGEVRSLAEAIGNETFEWVAPDGMLRCKFGRPRGFVSLDITDALGPDREASANWTNTYRALAGIREWNGVEVEQPRKAIHFQAALARFAGVGERRRRSLPQQLRLHVPRKDEPGDRGWAQGNRGRALRSRRRRSRDGRGRKSARKKIAGSVYVSSLITLLEHGIPWDVATTMPDDIRAGWTVAIGNRERPKDKQFDWSSMTFPEIT